MRITRTTAKPVHIAGADDFRGDFGKDQDGGDSQGADTGTICPPRDWRDGDDTDQRGGGRIDEVVAEQDDAQQCLSGTPRGARALGAMVAGLTARWRRRKRLEAIIAVSLSEKKRRTWLKENYQRQQRSADNRDVVHGSNATENGFGDEAATDARAGIEQNKAGQRPAWKTVPAASPGVPAQLKQRGKRYPMRRRQTGSCGQWTVTPNSSLGRTKCRDQQPAWKRFKTGQQHHRTAIRWSAVEKRAWLAEAAFHRSLVVQSPFGGQHEYGVRGRQELPAGCRRAWLQKVRRETRGLGDGQKNQMHVRGKIARQDRLRAGSQRQDHVGCMPSMQTVKLSSQ